MVNPSKKTGFRTPAQIAQDEDDEYSVRGLNDAFLDANGDPKNKPAADDQDQDAPKAEAAAVPIPGTVVVPMDDHKTAPVAKVDFGSSKWIKLEDGTRILDRGHSLYVEGHPASAMQVQYILKVAHERHWGKLATFKPNGHDIDPTLGNVLQMNGIPCCGEKEKHPSLSKCQNAAKEMLRELQQQQAAEQAAAAAIARAKAAAAQPAPVV